jgi:hypothetical protein
MAAQFDKEPQQSDAINDDNNAGTTGARGIDKQRQRQQWLCGR